MRFEIRSHLIWMLSFGLLAVGCGTMRKAEQVIPPTPEQIVSEHLSLRDPIDLLDDLEKYPEFKDRIENTLYRRINYDDYDYKELKEFSMLAQDDFDASVFFDSLLVDRQESVLSMLAEEEDVVQVGIFYRNNYQQYDFLHDVLKDAYFGEVDNLEYYGLRSLHMAFINTDLDKLVYPRYSMVRNEIVTGIMDELNPYFIAEKELLDGIDEEIRSNLETYIENGVVSVVSELSEKVDRGFFKRTFRRKDMDNYSVTEYAEKLVGEYLDQEYISDVINTGMTSFIQASTHTRMDYLKNYCEDASENSHYYISGEYGSDSIDLIADKSKAKDIQNLKAFNNATTIASFAMMFSPVGWAGLLVDALDFYNGLTESSKVKTMMDQLSEALYVSCTEQVDRYMSDLYTDIDKAREESQKYITRYFNEIF